MATLKGTTISETYPLLLKIASSGVDGTLRNIEDGDGTGSALQISTGGINVAGTITASGTSTFNGTVDINNTSDFGSNAMTNVNIDSGTINGTTITSSVDIVIDTAGKGLADEFGNNILERTAGGYITIGDSAWNEVRLNTTGSTDFVLDNSGNVGIGTTDPLGYGLNIESSNALRIKGADSSSNYHIRALDSASNVDFAVRGDGRVSIGHGTPSSLLDVRGNSSIVGFGTDSSADFGETYFASGVAINFGYGTNSNSGGFINYRGYQNGDTQFRDLTIADGKGSTVAFFDGSEKSLEIGTSAGSTPTAKLAVNVPVNAAGLELIPTTDNNSADTAVIRLWGTTFGTANRYSEIKNVTNGSTATNELHFDTNGSTALTIDSSQRVGIGTTDPSELLEVSSNTGTSTIDPTVIRISTTANGSSWNQTNDWGILEFYSADESGSSPGVHVSLGARALSSTGSASGFNIGLLNNPDALLINTTGEATITNKSSASATVSNVLTLKHSSSVGTGVGHGAAIKFNLQRANGSNQGAGSFESVTTTNTSSELSTDFTFNPAVGGVSTERMRIASDGVVSITASSNSPSSLNVIASGSGQAPNDAKVYVSKNSSADWSFMGIGGADDFGLKLNGAGNYALMIADHNQSSDVRSRISFNGYVYSTDGSIHDIDSDERKKEDIGFVESQWQMLKDLPLQKFKWKDRRAGDKYSYGWIAQNVQQKYPELVNIVPQTKEDIENEVEDPEYLTVMTGDIHRLAIKVLQEAMDKIETLEAKVEALENA